MPCAAPAGSKSQARLARTRTARFVHFLLQQPQPLHAHGGWQPHSGAHLQAPWALGRQAQAVLLEFEQGQWVVFMTASFFLEQFRCSFRLTRNPPAHYSQVWFVESPSLSHA